MSLLDDVSIVVTPNGYKAGELYAVIPSSGAADMDVTRATAATRVDENGLVNYAEIIGSEEVEDGDFPLPNTNWALIQATISNGDLNILTADGSFAHAIQNGAVQSGKTYKYSLNIKSLSGNLGLIIGGVTNIFTTAGTKTGYLTSVGTSVEIKRAGGSLDAVIDNISVKEVTRDNVPRIDYSGGGCPHILAEPERKNIVIQSEVFSSWGNTDTTLTSGISSPDGENNAYTLLSQVSGSDKITIGLTLSLSTTYNASVFVKKEASDLATVKIYTAETGFFAVSFNFNTLALTTIVGSTTNLKVQAYTDGWYRISYSFVTGATSTSGGSIQLNRSNANEGANYFGVQVVLGTYPTSYIPTSGSTVTRNQDTFSRDGISSLINSEEGVLFVEMAAFVKINPSGNITLTDGSGNNRIYIYYLVDNSISVIYNINSTGAVIHNFSLTDITQQNKIAVKWGNSNVSVYINGSSVLSTATSNFLPNTLNQLSFSKPSGSVPFEGKLKQLQVYKTALTDTQLAALTS